MESKEGIHRKVDWYDKILVLTSVLAILILFLYQLRHINAYAATWDQVDYSLALERLILWRCSHIFLVIPTLFWVDYLFINLLRIKRLL